MTGTFPWEQYFAGVGAPKIETLNVAQPDFFRQISDAVWAAADRGLARLLQLPPVAPGGAAVGRAV